MTPNKKKEDRLAEELTELVQSVTAAGKSILPSSAEDLLNSTVEAAAKIFGAAAASIMIVNEVQGVLEFKVAYGSANRDLVGTRIPLNQGIAGYVAMSGQPISISDVAQDSRFNLTFAKSTGYVPRSILATPLTIGDRVIGVMEVLDKIDAPSFGMRDMELLALFARQAALAIDQAQKIDSLNDALLMGLKQLATSNKEDLLENVLETLEKKLDARQPDDLLILVDLLREFSRMGEAEKELALKILATIAKYSQDQHWLGNKSGW